MWKRGFRWSDTLVTRSEAFRSNIIKHSAALTCNLGIQWSAGQQSRMQLRPVLLEEKGSEEIRPHQVKGE